MGRVHIAANMPTLWNKANEVLKHIVIALLLFISEWKGRVMLASVLYHLIGLGSNMQIILLL